MFSKFNLSIFQSTPTVLFFGYYRGVSTKPCGGQIVAQSFRSSMALLVDTELYSSKPIDAQGDLLLVPELIAVQLAHLMAKQLRNFPG